MRSKPFSVNAGSLHKTAAAPTSLALAHKLKADYGQVREQLGLGSAPDRVGAFDEIARSVILLVTLGRLADNQPTSGC